MKFWFVCLLVFSFFSGFAQADEDAEPMLSPRILALDTTLSIANRFGEEISNVATGYQYAFADNSQPRTVKKVYKTDNNETLKIEYKYTTEANEETGNAGKPVVIFQRISGEAGLMAKIYTFLFKTPVTADQLAAYSTQGIDIVYMGQTHQFIFQPDDYAPGYWEMTFVK
ncbi:MAG: hypothetical protein EOP51_11115 [Sphingobacteriales bacterium]|nr:MAG: hypothetical protein EOP51_11115 [Sphingobacteriales bacterium]